MILVLVFVLVVMIGVLDVVWVNEVDVVIELNDVGVGVMMGGGVVGFGMLLG